MKPVIFEEDAVDELAEAVAWYAARSSTAVAGLRRDVDAIVRRIIENPDRYPVVKETRRGVKIRRALRLSYPYAAAFIERPDDVRVIALAHLKRRPFYWLKRVR